MVISTRRIGSALVALALVAGCKGTPTSTKPPTSKSSVAPSAVPPVVGATATPGPLTTSAPITTTSTPPIGNNVISENGVGVISENGVGVLTNNGAGITGTVKALASLVPASYRLAGVAPEERGVGGVTVTLLTADGQQAKYTNGQPIATTTAADGSYTLKFGGNLHNMLVSAELPAAKGVVIGFVPKNITDKAVAVDIDTPGTLSLQYILEKYVRVQTEQIAVLDKLPPAVEADTRAKARAAFASGAVALPDALTAAKVVATVESLRKADKALNGQMELVRSLLFAGISNQGIGQPVTDVELDPLGLALAPSGEIYFCQPAAGRIFKKSVDGHLVVVAGNGKVYVTGTPEDLARGQGDNGPAIDAVLGPRDIAFDATGNLYVMESSFFRVRKISTDGIATTYAQFKAGSNLTAMAVGSDGTVYAALAHGIFRAPAGEAPVLVAGVDEQGSALQDVGTASGDGGPPLSARFAMVTSLAVDPLTGDVVAFDNGAIRRIGKETVSPIAGAPSFGTRAAIAYGPDGLLYVADSLKNYLRSVTRDGIVTNLAGTGSLGKQQDGTNLNTVVGVPFGVKVGPDNTVYFISQGVVRSLSRGKLSTIAGMIQLPSAPRAPRDVQFESPKWLRYDPAKDAMYVADMRHVWRWDLALDTLTMFGSAAMLGEEYHDGDPLDTAALIIPSALNLGADGSVEYFAKVILDGSMRLFKQTGREGVTVLKSVAGSTEELDSTAIAIGGPMYSPAVAVLNGLRYYTVASNGHIRRVEADGSTTSFAGYGTKKTDGTAAMDFKFLLPNVLEAGPDGALYVGSLAAVHRIDPVSQQVTRVFGKQDNALTLSPATGQLGVDVPTGLITGITWDARGRMIVSDLFKHTVMRREADGKMTILAGKGSANYAADGVDEGLGGPMGLAFDKRGDLFIADGGSGQVKRVAAATIP